MWNGCLQMRPATFRFKNPFKYISSFRWFLVTATMISKSVLSTDLIPCIHSRTDSPKDSLRSALPHGGRPVCVLVLIRYMVLLSFTRTISPSFSRRSKALRTVCLEYSNFSGLICLDGTYPCFKHSAGDQGAAPVIKLLVFQIILILTSRCSHIIKPPMLLLMPAFLPTNSGSRRCRFRAR